MTNQKKGRVELTPEQLYEVYLECNIPGAPVKAILEKYGLRPKDLAVIRKKVKNAVIEKLSHTGKPGRKQQTVPVERYKKVSKELEETKNKLAAASRELSQFKKRTS